MWIIYSFLILSILLTPSQNLKSFSSASRFMTVTFFKPFLTAGLTSIFETFPLTLAAIILLRITPTHLLPLHPVCTLFLCCMHCFGWLTHLHYLCSLQLHSYISFIHRNSVLFLLSLPPSPIHLPNPYVCGKESTVTGLLWISWTVRCQTTMVNTRVTSVSEVSTQRFDLGGSDAGFMASFCQHWHNAA